MRVLGLARQSSTDRRAGTIETQTELLTDACAELGHDLIHIVEDRVSGKFGALDDVQRKSAGWLTDPVKMGAYDAVMVSVRDRIDRDVTARLEFLKWAEQSGKLLLLTDGTEIHQRTADAWHSEASAALGAELYRRQVAEKRAAAARKQKRKGIIPQGDAGIPYGWRRGPDGRPVVVPDQAAVVRRICEMAARGESLAAIARQLNSEGVPTRYGKTWGTTILSRMIRNVGKPYAHAADGTPYYYPEVVAPDIAETARQRLSARAFTKDVQKVDAARKNSALLFGVAFCAAGHKLYAQRQDERNAYYRCYTCRGVTVRMDRLDGVVGDWILATLGDRDYEELRLIPATGHAQELADLVKRMDDVEAQVVNGLPIASATRILDALQGRRDELEAEPVTEAHTALVKTGETVREVWESGDLTRRRQLLTHDMSMRFTVWVEGGKLRIHSDYAEYAAMMLDEWTYVG